MSNPSKCPFCGSKNTELVSAYYGKYHYVMCHYCKASGPLKDAGGAVGSWNEASTRAWSGDK